EFSLETFAGPVFASLRGSLGITEEEYQQSLCSENCYLQFISNSKSKADFFLTNDKRFFLKTQNKREIKFLLANLKIYIKHLKNYPHSLLVKFLEHQRSWLIQQVEIDTNFLQRLNVLDYSFLLAYQPLHQDERNHSLSFASLIVRTKRTLSSWRDSALLPSLYHSRSVNPGSSPIYTSVVGVPGAVPDDDASRPFSESDSGLKLSHDGDTTGSSFSPTCPEHVGPGADTPEIPDFKTQNRRLLPNLKNPLHVIDGPEQRYFIGIIDIFTVYSFKKRLEHLWKSLRHPGRSFSTVSPDAYCLRLCQWVQDHTK
ncbi:hypothetical protein GOODEAATRI_013080, partial [Goodea atripinnis]